MSSVLSAKPLNRPATVFAVLSVIAVLGFAGVARLTNRYREQQKALARRLYARGTENQKSGRFDNALEYYRAALSYDRDNFQYQLSLARALRDSGRTDEAASYLLNLWERTPQDAYVNLALGRLAARQGTIDKTIQYYHNAIYGVWPANADVNRRNTELELVEFLSRAGAQPQAQAELISLADSVPADDLRVQVRVAQLFADTGMRDRALEIYERVLQKDANSIEALSGAGISAFKLARYRTAESYLRRAITLDPNSVENKQLLEISSLTVQMDPFDPHLPSAERRHRLQRALDLAGQRLDSCLASHPGSDGQGLSDLKVAWTQTRTKVGHDSGRDGEVSDAVMDLISQIEKRTQQECGGMEPRDQALLLISENRSGAER